MSFITQRRAATFLIAPLFAGLITACQEQPKEPEALSLDTPEKRLSYGIALRMGERMKSDGMTLDVDAYATGMRDAFEGAEAKLTDEEINAEMMGVSGKDAGGATSGTRSRCYCQRRRRCCVLG